MNRALLTSTSILALSVGSFVSAAVAADIPGKAAPKLAYAVPAPVFTWTGFYVGVTAGAGVSTSKSSATAEGSCGGSVVCVGNAGAAAAPYDSQYNAAPSAFGALKGTDVVAALGGTIGYNHQLSNNVVLGLEADLSWMSRRSANSASSASSYANSDNGYSGSNAATYTGARQQSISASSGPSALGTLRTRVGYAFDRTLVFATGGLAIGRVKSATSAAYNASTAYTDTSYGGLSGATNTQGAWAGSNSKTRVGWTIGAGVEHAVSNNVTLKVEALYYNLGKSTVTANGAAAYQDSGYGSGQNNDSRGTGTGTAQAYTVKQKVDGVVVRAGLNFKY